jgi:hypothetical protein
MITDPNDRALLEQQYDQLLSTLVLLARLLGKPCPVVTRKDRRHVDKSAILSLGADNEVPTNPVTSPHAFSSQSTHGV